MLKQAHEDFSRRLSALRADFTALGTRAADAAAALAARLPPPLALIDELSAARDAFAELRHEIVEHAGALALVLDSERLTTLRDLEPVLAAIGTAEARQEQREAWEEARESALVLLDRVMTLVHREDKGLGGLEECQARARELHRALSGRVPDDLEHETVMLSAKLRPFVELLALVDGWNVLDDNRCAFLQDAITESFSRPLALAALRGKLGFEGEPARPQARAGDRGPARESAALPAAHGDDTATPHTGPAYAFAPNGVDDGALHVSQAGAYPTLAAAPPPVTLPAGDAPMPGSGGPLPGSAVVSRGTPGVIASGGGVLVSAAGGGAGVAGGGAAVAGAGNSLVLEIRLSGDKINVETPEARREREDLLERLAHDNARWWIAARSGWEAMLERGATFADGAYDFLHRFPTLLSIPLQASADGAESVAEGYALLLAHIEKHEEGFVREALTRLNPQFATREKDQSYPLGQELYLYVVAEGRLYKTYPDFVKEVIVNALPQAKPWVQGGLIERDDETRRFTRPQRVGSSEEQTETVTGWKERTEPHRFTVTVEPLTTRFFTLQLAGPLEDPPDVEIRLRENDAPTDHAWLITLPMPGQVQPLAPRRHRTGGTTLPGLGREFSGLWISVFNADASHDRHYELEVTLRRKPPTDLSKEPDTPAAAPTSTPLLSRFFGRTR